MRSPARIVQAMVLLGVAITLAAIWLGSRQPNFDMVLVLVDGTVVAVDGGQIRVPVAIASPEIRARPMRKVDILPIDLTLDSDELNSAAELNRFYVRQTTLSAMMRIPGAQIRAGEVSRPVRGARGFLGNPIGFWVILLPGLVGVGVSAIVLAAAPAALPNRLVALTGALFPFVVAGPSITISRSLAIDGELYRWLMFSHELSAMIFAVVMVVLFCVYPRRILPERWLHPGAIVVVAWIVLIAVGRFLEWTHDTGDDIAGALVWLRQATGGSQVGVTILFIALCAALAAQFRVTRRDPLSRAALTWFGLAVALGAGGFIILLTLPNLLGTRAVVDGTVGFPLLLLIYAGLAFGLLRYRLFEAKAWSFRILFVGCATAVLWGIDAAMIYGLGLDQGPALGLAVVMVGLGYQPARAAFASMLLGRRRTRDITMFGAAVEVAFASPVLREARWQALLQRLFDPLEIAHHSVDAVTSTQIVEDGLAMLVCGPTEIGSTRIAYPDRGTRLFSPEDQALLDEMISLCRHATEALRSYDRGAADERQRMAQDLHDDIGARLLSGIHIAQGPVRTLLQDALRDIRTLVTGLIGESAPISRVIADIRHETASRMEAADIVLDWPILIAIDDRLLPYRMSKAVTSAIREAVSNTIRHSGARCLSVRIAVDHRTASIVIQDDGCGMAQVTSYGTGLNGITARMASIGGTLQVDHSGRGTRLTLCWPLDTPSAAAALQRDMQYAG